MTEIQLYQPTTALMNATNQKAINELALRLQKFAPGGSKLSLEQASQLAVYSIMIDANPYAGESYMTPTGPMIGIPLYRRKAKEWNRVMGGNDDWDYKVSFRLAEDHEASFDPAKGDVAWVCELTDTKAEKEWQDSFVKFFNLLIEAEAPYDFADKRASQMAGPRPVWSAVGVVAGAEKFSKGEVERWEGKKPIIKKDENGDLIYKPEMWDRNERAKKRAEKGALKKRYPDLTIPEYHEVATDNNVTVLVQNAEGNLVEAEEIRKEAVKNLDPDQEIIDMGFTPDPPAPTYEQLDKQMGPNYTPLDPPTPDPLWDDNNAVDIYSKVVSSKGIPYSEIDLATISNMYNSLNRKVKKLKTEAMDGKEMTEEEVKALDENELKRSAALYYRDKLAEEAKGNG